MVSGSHETMYTVSGMFLLARAVLAVVGKDMTALGLLLPETGSETEACCKRLR